MKSQAMELTVFGKQMFNNSQQVESTYSYNVCDLLVLTIENGSWGLWFCGDSSGSTNGYAISGEKIIYAQCGWESSYFLTGMIFVGL
jgi:hypothetical protein